MRSPSITYPLLTACGYYTLVSSKGLDKCSSVPFKHLHSFPARRGKDSYSEKTGQCKNVYWINAGVPAADVLQILSFWWICLVRVDLLSGFEDSTFMNAFLAAVRMFVFSIFSERWQITSLNVYRHYCAVILNK